MNELLSMPLLDTASFQNHLGILRDRARANKILPCNFTLEKAKRLSFAWEFFPIPKKLDLNLGRYETSRSKFLIKAVTTLERRISLQSEYGKVGQNILKPTIDQDRPSNEDSKEVDKRETLRRTRISKANKGNTPWNKGRKHSAETIQRIKERTRLAMQNPKVKMKLANLGHAQSEETKLKIKIGVQMGWQRRREKLLLQEDCHFEWQNLIAEASRRGYVGEEEHQFDSYKVLNEKFEQEWLESVEQRKITLGPKDGKRATKSLEQRRKISEAISAKWADPGYRNRVCSGLSKHYGVPVGVEKIPKTRPIKDREIIPAKEKSAMEKYTDKINFAGKSSIIHTVRSKVKRSKKVELYKDPLVNSKLEMIKNIRAQRVIVAGTNKSEAIERARLMIAEAEKAAKALEVSASRSPLARASLTETRKLIAEAIQSIESIDGEHFTIAQKSNLVDQEIDTFPNGVQKKKVNGYHHSLPLDLNGLVNQPGLIKAVDLKINGIKMHNVEEKVFSISNGSTRKWVRGRLIDVTDD